MNEKLVTLKVEGDLQTAGFHVLLEIGAEGARPEVEAIGSLPPNPPLLQQLQKWQQGYRLLDTSARIQPKQIVYVGSLHAVEACRQAAEGLDQLFRDWLASPSLVAIDRHLREELRPSDAIRIVIRTTNPHLQHLPWHLWDVVDRYPHAEVALGLPTITRMPDSAPVPPRTAVKILAILGDSAGIDIDADRQLLESIPGAAVTFLVEPRRQQITDQLWEQPWDLLFFAGHGQTDEDTGRIYINSQESLTLEELKYGLRQAVRQGLQLAIFNACDGLGLANALAPLGLPQMILMREPVPDQVAQTFLKYFLDAFVAGDSLYRAARKARERLQGLEDRFPCASWLPIIFQVDPAVPKSWHQLRLAADSQNIYSTRLKRGPHIGGLSLKSLLSVAAIAAASVGLLRWAGGLQRWELQAYDRLMRSQPAETIPPRLLIVEATEEDINTYGYPLPDNVLAQAITMLKPYQPRVIGLDIFRDRLSADGGQFGQYLQQQDNLVALCSFGQADDTNQAGIAPPPNVPEERVGFSNVVIDPDGVVRRQLLFAQPDTTGPCTSRFSLGALMALLYLEAEDIEAENLEDQRLRLGAAVFTPLEAHTGPYQGIDARGFQILLNYVRSESFAQRISLSQLLSGETELNSLENQAVLIGMSAPTSNPTDYFLTPLGAGQWPQEPTPGVEIHAQMIDQLLAAALDGRAVLKTWPSWAEWLWIGVWAMVGGGLVVRRVSIWSWLLGLGLSTLALTGICWGLLGLGLWLPLVPAALAMMVASGGAILLGRGSANAATQFRPANHSTKHKLTTSG
ncbi:MAG: CHASE2 domain-containing protein [Cyanobacteria bacterium P01_D01_bin.44]